MRVITEKQMQPSGWVANRYERTFESTHAVKIKQKTEKKTVFR